ncbi:MAG TPA: hypothetical protein VHP33_06850 [Polyangiaceae bacterium]|nr:hypothetical protein [Polyangiaceae bacterium]
MQRRALLLGLGVVACGPKPRPALPPAPSISSAAELIPPDLDVVVRLDLARVKATLGGAALTAVSREVLARDHERDQHQEPDELLIASLLGAEQVYLGYRPSRLWAPLDRVLALQGHFEQLVRPPVGFSRPTDLGRDLRYWDAQVPPKARGGVARVYALGDRVRAFVSEAEIDAVERLLAGQASPRRLEPPEEGTLSLAARPQLLGRLVGNGTLRELVEGAQALLAVVELESDGVRLKLELALSGADEARQLANAGQLVLSRALGDAKLNVTLRADAQRVLLNAQLSRAELAPLLACVWAAPAGSAAGCPW